MFRRLKRWWYGQQMYAQGGVFPPSLKDMIEVAMTGKVICSCGQHHPDGVHVMTPEECADDVIGPDHELYPILKDAMESKSAVFYERDEKTGKMKKKE